MNAPSEAKPQAQPLIIHNPLSTQNDGELTAKQNKRREYMRNYKRQAYSENKDEMRDKNRQYYYKYKFDLNADDMKKYGSLLPLVCKIKKNLAELQKADESILTEILSPFHHHKKD